MMCQMGFWNSHTPNSHLSEKMDGSATLDKAQPCRVKVAGANAISRPYSLGISCLRERSNNYDVCWLENVGKKMNNDQIGQLDNNIRHDVTTF